MTSFTIADADLVGIKDQVIVVTGASSGIGLATVKRLLQHGAKVFAGDLNPLPEPEKSTVPFRKVDVTSWSDQVELFKAAKEEYGYIDHVFANAGIPPSTMLLEDDVDENGGLLPPNLKTINVNLIGCMYTVKLGIHYIKQNPKGGSLVVTASASSFCRLSQVDYTTTKHGVLGLVRSLHNHPRFSNRINAVAPSWTATAIMPPAFVAALGNVMQSTDVVARSVVLLMADAKRNGECIYVENGKFWDVENGENGFHEKLKEMMPGSDLARGMAIAEKIIQAAEAAEAARAKKATEKL